MRPLPFRRQNKKNPDYKNESDICCNQDLSVPGRDPQTILLRLYTQINYSIRFNNIAYLLGFFNYLWSYLYFQSLLKAYYT
jgi:hypothetical protein